MCISAEKQACRFTVYHCHYEIDYLLSRSDEVLAQMLKGGDPAEMRAALVCMKAAGKRVLVIGECDHKRLDGYCAGHPSDT